MEAVYLCVHTTDLFHHTQKTLSTAWNSMTSSEWPSSEKKSIPNRSEGERVLEMLWKPQMP